VTSQAALSGVVALLDDASMPLEHRVRAALLVLRPMADALPEPPPRPVTESAIRMRRHRERHRVTPRDGPEDVTCDVSRDVTVGGKGGDLPSDLPVKTLPPSRSKNETTGEREAQVTSQVTPSNALPGVRVVGPGQLVCVKTPITPELSSIASIAGVQDIEGAWLKFTGHYNGQRVENLTGKWQLWCGRERTDERTRRDKLAGRATRSSQDHQADEAAKLAEANAVGLRIAARNAAFAADREQQGRADAAGARKPSEPVRMGGGNR
jgi:hypothetical protein